MTPEQMRTQVTEDLARWGRTIRDAGIKME
jgi:tripartite-type tricarboxylate transporter receptor subunit TctC